LNILTTYSHDSISNSD